MKKVLLHIGKHKTGSTSFQYFLRKSRKVLEGSGFCVLPLRFGNRIAAVAVRDGLPIPPRDSLKKSDVIPVDGIAGEIAQFLKDKEFETLVVSSEHLSYFRTSAEIAKMREAFPSELEYSIYLVTRDREDFRISYRDQITSTGHGPSDDPSSPYYCEKDSWLLDDDALIQAWKGEFENVTVLEYSKSGMVQKLGAAMGLPETVLEKEYRLNVTSAWWENAKLGIKKFVKKLPFGRGFLMKFRRWRWG